MRETDGERPQKPLENTVFTRGLKKRLGLFIFDVRTTIMLKTQMFMFTVGQGLCSCRRCPSIFLPSISTLKYRKTRAGIIFTHFGLNLS